MSARPVADTVADTVALTGRSLRHVLRSPDTIITTVVMPIAFLLLFVFVFGGAIQTGGGFDGRLSIRAAGRGAFTQGQFGHGAENGGCGPLGGRPPCPANEQTETLIHLCLLNCAGNNHC